LQLKYSEVSKTHDHKAHKYCRALNARILYPSLTLDLTFVLPKQITLASEYNPYYVVFSDSSDEYKVGWQIDRNFGKLIELSSVRIAFMQSIMFTVRQMKINVEYRCMWYIMYG
jgi:hypothetical protein